jgi:hypothetical protein
VLGHCPHVEQARIRNVTPAIIWASAGSSSKPIAMTTAMGFMPAFDCRTAFSTIRGSINTSGAAGSSRNRKAIILSSVRWWVDGVEQTSTSVSLTAGRRSFWNRLVFDTDVFGGQELIDSPFELGNTAGALAIELYNNTANQDFFLSQLLIDYKPMGAKPS